MSDALLFVRAADFAARKHINQRRLGADEAPYINHPLAVAAVLASVGGVTDPVTLAAALLHDTIEDTDTTAEELAAQFGPEVAHVVREVSDDKALPKAERKRLQVVHAPTLTERAKLVKLADKICNVTDIRTTPPEHWSHSRRESYVQWAAEVVSGLRGIHTELEAHFDAVVASAPPAPEPTD